jgi:hypothetical protein
MTKSEGMAFSRVGAVKKSTRLGWTALALCLAAALASCAQAARAGCVSDGLRTTSEASLSAFASVDASKFRDALEKSRHPTHPDLIWVRTTQEYQQVIDDGGRLFLSADGLTGFGVTRDGGLISLFNNGQTKGMGAEAVRAAIRLGVRHLDCWGEPLVRYYEKFGFRVKRSEAWKEEWWINDAPPADPKPRVYFMELEP